MEVLWKAITGIINRRLSSSNPFHDIPYSFFSGRGIGTATLKEWLIQHLTATREAVLHYIFLDLRKSYYDLDRYSCLYILVGYGVGPRTIYILRIYWAWLQMAAKAGGN